MTGQFRSASSTTTMSKTKLRCNNSTAEALAQKAFLYESIFEEQSEFFRQCPALYEEARERLTLSGAIGNPQLPTPAERDVVMAHSERLCKIQPRTIDE